jgi:winged helix DNA-binding protein
MAGTLGLGTLKSLNRRLMSKQLLTVKARGPRAVVATADACCGINSQDFLESIDSFWARVEGFRDSDFYGELRPGEGLSRTWTVRGTMHTFPSMDYFVHVFGSGRRRTLAAYERWAKELGIPPLEFRVESLYQPLLDEIKGRAVPSTFIKKWMMERLEKHGLRSKLMLRRGWSNQATPGPAWTGITEMSYLGLLAGAGRKGSESMWMGVRDWLSSGKEAPETDDCILRLVRNYVEQYGPVTRDDVAFWNNRLFAKEVDGAIRELRKDLVEERLKGSDMVHYSLGDWDDCPPPPRAVVLPEFDSLIMGYGDRSRFLDPRRLTLVSRPQGMISRTILLDGFVAATWQRKKVKGRTEVSVHPFRQFTAAERRSTEERFSEYGEYRAESLGVKFK